MIKSSSLIGEKQHTFTLMYAALIAGLCSIIYELLIATTASYFLGDSITWFSLTIGLYMAAMGVGSFASQYIRQRLLQRFVLIEILLGLSGGLSVPLLYLSYSFNEGFMLAYIALTLVVGLLIGMEIPLLTRLMEPYHQLRFNIANILSLDYLGALIATLAFPFLLLPMFGVYQSSLIFGLINMSIGVVVLLLFRQSLDTSRTSLWGITILSSLFIVLMLLFSTQALKLWDSSLYQDRIVFSQQTRYQHIVLTKGRDDVRLFLNGNLQFSSVDEYRYHESLIHVPMSMQRTPVRRVLLLGAGDGLAVRELLKYPQIEEIVLVDLDAAVIDLARHNPYIHGLNQGSLDNPRVTVEINDAFSYLKQHTQPFDFIICDLPDPNNNALARLYSSQFYRLLSQRLAHDGIFVTQATSPYYATQAFWSIVHTLRASPLSQVLPYHANIPSFGDWGFVMAARHPLPIQMSKLHVSTRYLNASVFPGMFSFSQDILANAAEINAIDRPVLLHYYLKGWEHYAR